MTYLESSQVLKEGQLALTTLLTHSMGRILDVVYLSLFLFVPVYYSANASSVLELATIFDPGHLSPIDNDTSNGPRVPPRDADEAMCPDEGIQMTTINTVSVPDMTASDPARSPSETLDGSTFPAFPSPPTEQQPSALLQDAWAAYIEMCLTEWKYFISLSSIIIAYVDVSP